MTYSYTKMDQENHQYSQDVKLEDLLPCMMADLLEYFEERARVLDSMAPTIQTSAAMCNPNFISCITFNGIPILPPVLTARRREEMQEYKRQAMRHDYQRKTRQREQMNMRLNSLVKDVEKSYSLKSRVSLPRTVGLSKLLEKKASRWTDLKQTEEQEVPTRDITPKTQLGKKSTSANLDNNPTKQKVERSSRPVEVKSRINSTARRRHRSGSQGSDDEVKSEMTVLKKTHTSRRRTNSEGEKDNPKSEPIKTKQKHRIPIPDKKPKTSGVAPKAKVSTTRGNSIESLRRSSSLSSLPNLAKIQGVNAIAIPKPPSSQMTEQQQIRQLSLRHYSSSQPDLRTLSAENISFSPPTKRSHSKDDISNLDSVSSVSISRDHSMSNPDLHRSSSTSDIQKDTVGKISDRDPIQTSGKNQEQRKVSSEIVDSKKQNISAKTKVNTDSELVKQVQVSKKQTQNSLLTRSRNTRTSANSETSESGTASSDFPSLEGCNSLPHEIDGLRFTSVRQQHIGHTLDKLSKVLNMEETLSTLNSTSSNEIQENIARLRQSAQSSQVAASTQSSVQSQSFERTGGRRSNASPQSAIPNTAETPSPKTSDSTAPASTPSSAEQSFGSNTSGSSNTSQSNVGATSASMMSSSSSVTGSQSGGAPSRRMSPKGLKNTVHFAPLVTEISTSASQSLEDKISVRKLDITPTNSIQFDSGGQGGRTGQTGQDRKGSAKNQTSDSGTVPPTVHVTIPSSESMLSKVALSPETDSPQTPVDCLANNMPFETYGQHMDGDVNTSDKENTRPQGRLEISDRYTTGGTRAPVDQLLVKSQNSDDGSQTSTLKGSQDLLGERTSTRQETDFQAQQGRPPNVNPAQQSSAMNINPRIAAQSQPKLMGRSVADSLQSTQESSRPTIRGNMPINISGKVSHVSQKVYDLQQNTQKDLVKPVPYQQAPPILTHPVAHQHSCSQSQAPNPKTSDRASNGGLQRKLNMDAGTNFIPPKSTTGDSDGEREAKAEHIQKYLNHVQRHSLESDGDSTDASKPSNVKKSSPNSPFDIRSTIQSFTSSLQSLSQTDEEELLRIQAEHFDKLRRHLIEQQKQQLEELFVHQRREQMVLQTDIEKYQNQLQEQEDFLAKNSSSFNSSQQLPANYTHCFPDMMHQSQQDNRSLPNQSLSNIPVQAQLNLQPNVPNSISYSQPSSNSHSFSHSDSQSFSRPPPNSQSFSNFHQDTQSHPQQLHPSHPNHQPHLKPQQPPPTSQPPHHTNIPQQSDPAHQPYTQNYQYLEQYVQRMNLHPGYSQQQQQQHAAYNSVYTADHGSYPPSQSHTYRNMPQQSMDVHDPNYFKQASSQRPPQESIQYHDPPPPKYSQHNPHSRVQGSMYDPCDNGRDPQHGPPNPPAQHHHPEDLYQSPPHNDHDTSHQYSYVPSPSLYYNPRDNGSDISTFSKATPKQSLTFNNHSTPTPKIHKPVLRSPIKQPSLSFPDQQVVVPDFVYNAKLKQCFDRVSACVKGYLTRRLMRTEKVQEILKTIKDTKEFAWQFQAETPIKRGDFSHSDRHLLDRIIAQLKAALLDIHEIFFEIPVWERMSLISQSRQAQEEKRLRESAGTRSSVSSSHPRISSATLKAIERKRKQEEEVAVSTDSRPRSAPPPTDNTISSSTYSGVPSHPGAMTQARMISQNNVRPNSHMNATNMDQRALRPLPGQGQGSQTQGQPSRITTRPKERTKTTANQTSGQTAPHPYLIAKSKKSNITGVKDKPSNKTTTKSSGTSSTSTTTAAKNKSAGSKVKPKITDKASKAWRG
ncbi:serine-rich adhesin for platelets-like isoform X2 [Argopecten irradians]|uniref:serine-rich adhesin for platelets-like isoform X2 n=1 Tax=Argopecten irradians TaxID=31199 RepID=UPI00371793B7